MDVAVRSNDPKGSTEAYDVKQRGIRVFPHSHLDEQEAESDGRESKDLEASSLYVLLPLP